MCFRLLSIILIFIVLIVGEARKSIFISENILSPTLTKVTCTISDDRGVQQSTYLHCPILDSDICYKNCSPECKYENENCLIPPELKSITKCDQKIEENDHVTFQYTINVEKIKKVNGEWYCSYEGTNSKPIKLEVFKKPMNYVANITKLPHTSLVKQSTKKGKVIGGPVSKIPAVVFDSPNDPIISVSQPSVPKIYNVNEFNFRIFITNYQVVIGIIILLSISILLNFIFCIRDSMIKQFIDNMKSNVSSNTYLLCCICQNELDGISATAKLDRVLAKECDYSTDASNCSKNDIFNSDIQRPLISPMYPNVGVNSSYNTNITRSASLQNPEISPNMNYDQIYLTTPRGMQPYLYSPCIMTRTNLGNHERLSEYANQRHSHVFQPHVNIQNLKADFQNPNIKKHGSQNNIDLIRSCDSQDQFPKAENSINT